ncbi:MAG: Tn3 family transposase [Acidobacteria bacterium]|nr:Tn3 family transposase [Acidobacteriota bacterium]
MAAPARQRRGAFAPICRAAAVQARTAQELIGGDRCDSSRGVVGGCRGLSACSWRLGWPWRLRSSSRRTEPGVKAYSHVSDRFSPFATQTIPATVHEAPYILDGLLMNETGRRVREQYADTGGFTDHVFAACSILGYAFVPRIRDLPSKRLYVFDRADVPKLLRPLVGGKVNVDLIDRNWADILRVAATMSAGTLRPSQILRKLAAYPRQNELAAALREVGRVERSLFMIDWTTDPGMRRRVQVGLNKGEAHHALKRAINFHQRGELRDRTGEGQHYRVAGLNLLAAIIIYWNTLKLGEAVFARRKAGSASPAEFLAHVSPLGWEHINLTGEYRWPRTGSTGRAKSLA